MQRTQEILDLLAYVQAKFPSYPEGRSFEYLILTALKLLDESLLSVTSTEHKQWLELAAPELRKAQELYRNAALVDAKQAVRAARELVESFEANRAIEPSFVVNAAGVTTVVR